MSGSGRSVCPRDVRRPQTSAGVEHLALERFLAEAPELRVLHAVAIDRESTVRAHKSHLVRSAQCPKQSECHCDQDNTTGSTDGEPLPKAQVFSPGDEAKDPPPYAAREEDKEGRFCEGSYRFPIQTSSAGLRNA